MYGAQWLDFLLLPRAGMSRARSDGESIPIFANGGGASRSRKKSVNCPEMRALAVVSLVDTTMLSHSAGIVDVIFLFPSVHRGSGVAVIHGGLPQSCSQVAQSHPSRTDFRGAPSRFRRGLRRLSITSLLAIPWSRYRVRGALPEFQRVAGLIPGPSIPLPHLERLRSAPSMEQNTSSIA